MRFMHQLLGTVSSIDLTTGEFEAFDDDDKIAIIDSDGDLSWVRKKHLTLIEEPVVRCCSLNDLADEILEVNISKGFTDMHEDPNIDQMLLLTIGEIVEAQEELRAGHSPTEIYYPTPKLPYSLVAEVGVLKAEQLMQKDAESKPQKAEGFPVEIADTIIRLLHISARLGLDIDGVVRAKIEYNRTRSFKHGKAF